MAKVEKSDRANIYYYVEDHFHKTPDKVFLVYQGQEWTYKQALDEIHRRANYFLSLGINKHEIVALNFTNKASFVWAYFGLWAIGATPAFLNYNLADASLLHCLKVSTARFVLFDDEIAANMATVKDQLSSVPIRAICHKEGQGVDWAENITPSDFARQPTTRPPDSRRNKQKITDPAQLIYTSGSTGMPKAAIVPWSKYASGVKASSSIVGLRATDRFYSCMPLYHATASILGLGSCLMVGSTFIIGHKFSNKTFWKDVSENDATVVQYVGEVCRFLCSAPPSPFERKHRVRLAYGNGMRPDVWERFRSRFNIQEICEFYASTEGVGGSFNTNTNSFGAGAVGRAGKVVRALAANQLILRIDLDTEEPLRDAKGLCVPAETGEPGELAYLVEQGVPERSFVGYFGNKKASESKLLRDVQKKGDVFMRTGDLMSVDADGFIYFNDRLGDTYRFQSENVSTTEVAEAIGNFPGILEANVYGVQVPNLDGRAGCVAICRDPVGSLNYTELSAHLSRTLPKYAVPRFLRIMEKMQSTGNYKQQKTGLRAEGVAHAKVGGDELLWLRDGTYVPFTPEHFNHLVAGKARL